MGNSYSETYALGEKCVSRSRREHQDGEVAQAKRTTQGRGP